jgi:hypothetical protein
MIDDTTPRDDEELVPDEEPEVEEDVLSEADQAEAEEAEAAEAEEEFFDDEGDAFLDEEAVMAQREEAMAEANISNMRAQAEWFLVHKELLLLLLANCLFFAGVLAAWGRTLPWDERAQVKAARQAQVTLMTAEEEFAAAEELWEVDKSPANGVAMDQARANLAVARATVDAADAGPAPTLYGLGTIRGALIFALALYGFWVIFLNFRYRQTMVWPFLINAILALWVGIPGFTNNFGSEHWTLAEKYMEQETASFLAKLMAPLSNTPPGHWLLTFAGAIVLVVLLRGILSGRSKTKARAAASGGRRRR